MIIGGSRQNSATSRVNGHSHVNKKRTCNKQNTRSKGTAFHPYPYHFRVGRANDSSGSVGCKPTRVWIGKRSYASFGIQTWQHCGEKKKQSESDEPYGVVIDRGAITSENPEGTAIIGHFSVYSGLLIRIVSTIRPRSNIRREIRVFILLRFSHLNSLENP